MTMLWGYFLGTVVGSCLGVILAFAWLDIQDNNNRNNRNRRR